MRLWMIVSSLLLLTATCHARDADRLARTINQRVADRIEAAGAIPAPLVDDAGFLRRVSLDLIGRIPTPEEVIAFLDDADPNKRAALVDRLIASDDHADHFARAWRALLLPESDTDRQVRYFVPGFEAFLRDRRIERAGFDSIVRELLTVPITGTKERPQLVLTDLKAANPIAFIAAKNASAPEIASTTTRFFLGLRLECAQCHNHPFDQWTQTQFWNQAAFFAGIERKGRGTFAPILEDRERATIQQQGIDTLVPAQFLDSAEPAAHTAEPLRVGLAAWITSKDNPFFARAMANRVWGELLGMGIVDPVDDMHASNPPSHPELLDELAAAFRDSGFDIGLLYAAICRSEAYQRSSRETDLSQSQPSLFARRTIKPMNGEQFFDSFASSVGYQTPGRVGRDDDATRRRVVEQFATYGLQRDPETSVVQALTLMNGRLINDAASPDKGKRLQALLADESLTDSDRIDRLYLLTLSRKPTDEERHDLEAFVHSGGDAERARRLGDIFWVLLNSAEFHWNH